VGVWSMGKKLRGRHVLRVTVTWNFNKRAPGRLGIIVYRQLAAVLSRRQDVIPVPSQPDTASKSIVGTSLLSGVDRWADQGGGMAGRRLGVSIIGERALGEDVILPAVRS
jgi:hypothetical protein